MEIVHSDLRNYYRYCLFIGCALLIAGGVGGSMKPFASAMVPIGIGLLGMAQGIRYACMTPDQRRGWHLRRSVLLVVLVSIPAALFAYRML